ncbi:nucleoside diphosphate phosphatase ENTPD5 isoform X1 [Anomaloglossus baeobatrachus]|uniref:nucleoside diphosphate phosphatase ENTPD5 isoform X1 n=1 Tax=Anomaloglossus baeobatrachus TaxID=238106 RepID=UPI003F50C9E2
MRVDHAPQRMTRNLHNYWKSGENVLYNHYSKESKSKTEINAEVHRVWEIMRPWIIAAFTFCCSLFPGFSLSDPSVTYGGTSPLTYAVRVPTISRDIMYGIVFDAGATGTRIHIYTFRPSSTRPSLEIDGEIFESLKPGLSAFAQQPEQGAESVRSLLQLALDNIPSTHWKKTPLLLKATAGLRLLPALQAEALLQEVRKVFSSSPFLVPGNSVSIMDGTDEGVLAWITVNYLTGLLDGDRTVGILDLGGGSTQITFLPLAKATLDQTPADFLTSFELFNSTYRLYTRRYFIITCLALDISPCLEVLSLLLWTISLLPYGSHSVRSFYTAAMCYLGLGLKAARLAVLGASVSAAEQNQTFRSHCVPADVEARWTFAGITYTYAGQSDGLVGFDACYSEVQHILQGKFHHVDEIHGRRFYAFSYYYDRAVDTSLIEHEDVGELTIRDFAGKAQEVCDHMDRFTSQSPFLCMDLSYITALLREGFGFEEDTIIQLAKKVREIETSWTLGAIIQELQHLL